MYYGLLAPEDKQQAIVQGLLGFGAEAIRNSGPSTVPRGLLSAVGSGMVGFQQGINNYAGGVQRNKMAEAHMADIEQKRRDAEIKRTARENLLNIDPTKLSDPSMLPQLMAASDDPASTLVAWNKSNQKPGPMSSIGKLHSDFQNGILPEGIYQAGLNKATTSQPLVNMGPGETEEAKGVGRGYADRYNALLEQGGAARRNMATLADIEPLIDQVSTGTGAPAGLAVKSFFKRINVDPTSIGLADDVAQGEALRSLSNQLTLMLRSSEGMPASGFSDADRAFLEAIPPNLGNTPEGNKLLAKLLRKKFERTQQMAWEAQKYFNQRGTFRGFEIENPLSQQPIWGDEDIQQLVEVSQNANPLPEQYGPFVTGPNTSGPKPDALGQPGRPDEDALDEYLRKQGLRQ